MGKRVGMPIVTEKVEKLWLWLWLWLWLICLRGVRDGGSGEGEKQGEVRRIGGDDGGCRLGLREVKI